MAKDGLRFQPGDRVWAPWKSNSLAVGTIDIFENEEAHIHFDDGNRGWVQVNQLMALQIPVVLRVQGRWQMGFFFYPGTIGQVAGERIFIQYDDGDREWTTPAALKVPCDPFGPDARPTKVASHWNFRHLGCLVAAVIIVVVMLLRLVR